MKTFISIIVVSLIVSLTLAWTFRYHVVVGNESLTVYSIDRWTGEVSLIAPEPVVRSMTSGSQPLVFVHTPLVSLREPAYQDQVMETLSDDSDSDE